MKVTLNWLKQYVDFNWSPEELTERLTMLGLEVEGVQKISGAFDGIVVAQILTRDNVPGSDKLSVCRVNDGTGERTDHLRRAESQARRQGAAHPAEFRVAAEGRRQGAVRHQGTESFRHHEPRHDVFAAGTRPAGHKWTACSSCPPTRPSESRSANISAAAAATWFMIWKSRRTGRT